MPFPSLRPCRLTLPIFGIILVLARIAVACERGGEGFKVFYFFSRRATVETTQ